MITLEKLFYQEDQAIRRAHHRNSLRPLAEVQVQVAGARLLRKALYHSHYKLCNCMNHPRTMAFNIPLVWCRGPVQPSNLSLNITNITHSTHKL